MVWAVLVVDKSVRFIRRMVNGKDSAMSESRYRNEWVLSMGAVNESRGGLMRVPAQCWVLVPLSYSVLVWWSDARVSSNRGLCMMRVTAHPAELTFR